MLPSTVKASPADGIETTTAPFASIASRSEQPFVANVKDVASLVPIFMGQVDNH